MCLNGVQRDKFTWTLFAITEQLTTQLPILNHTDPYYFLPLCFFKVRLNIILQPTHICTPPLPPPVAHGAYLKQ